jgi:hypothetical protein
MPDLRDPAPRRQRRRTRRLWIVRRFESLATTTRELASHPGSIGTRLREAAIEIWSTRGGGFYGLGYLVTFVVLEVQAFVSGLETTDAVTFFETELLQMFFRFAWQSVLNSFVAFVWPAFVVDYLKGWGVVALVVGWWLYGRFAAPYVARLGLVARKRDSKRRRGKRRDARRGAIEDRGRARSHEETEARADATPDREGK